MKDEGRARSFPISDWERMRPSKATELPESACAQTLFGRKPGNLGQTIGRMLLVGGLALLLGIVGVGSLAAVWAAPGGTAAAAQIGIQACPTNLAIGFTPTNPDSGQTVEFEPQFTNSGGTGQITFTWNFGDQSAEMTGQVVNHSYTLNGVYQVTLTATGDTCAPQPAPVTRLITVGFGPPAAIIYLPLVFKNYSEIIFPTSNQLIEPAPTGILVQN